MKIFILLLIVGFVAAEYEVKILDDLMHYHDECAAANYLPAETFAHFKEQEYGFDKTTYCHIACLAKKIGVYDAEHGIKVDNWVTQVAAASDKTVDEVKPKIIACVEEIAQYKDYPCLWAYKGFTCTAKAGYVVIDRLSTRSLWEARRQQQRREQKQKNKG